VGKARAQKAHCLEVYAHALVGDIADKNPHRVRGVNGKAGRDCFSRSPAHSGVPVKCVPNETEKYVRRYKIGARLSRPLKSGHDAPKGSYES
jgi:hypothetical protein